MSSWFALGMGMDTRIGPHFLFPGLGYGGGCFPGHPGARRPWGASTALIYCFVDATTRINQRQRQRLLAKLYRHFGLPAPSEPPLVSRSPARPWLSGAVVCPRPMTSAKRPPSP